MLKKIKLPLTIYMLLMISQSFAQQTSSPIGTVAFYNVENLFDTEDDPATNDEEYLVDGEKQWSKERYYSKLLNISKVLSEMAGGADIIGLSEVENRKVLEDLVQTPNLLPFKYQIVHFDSPDRRGIDVALIYRHGIYLPFAMHKIEFKDPDNPNFKTRDMLWVKGLYHGDTLNVVVNHWPSRRGGKEDKRIMAAQFLRNAIDSVQQINPQAKIIVMGDLNDDPRNKSVRKILLADDNMKPLPTNELYNTSAPTFKQGYGTLYYNGAWNLFDQIIISKSLLEGNSETYYYLKNSFRVFAPQYMQEPEGQYQGAPLRTFSRGVYKNGYSDHYPAFIVLSK